MARPTSALLSSSDSCAIYMFTLPISICCSWNNQLQGPGGGVPVNRAQLGFHDFGEGGGVWLGLIMLKLGWWWGGLAQGFRGKQGLLGRVRVGSFGEASQSAGHERPGPNSLMGFRHRPPKHSTLKKIPNVYFCPLTFLLNCWGCN